MIKVRVKMIWQCLYTYICSLCKSFLCILFLSRNLFFGRRADEIKDEDEEHKKEYDFVLDLSHLSWIYVWILFGVFGKDE